MQPIERPRHRVFPEGFDTRRGRSLNERQRAEREQKFREARNLRQAEDRIVIDEVRRALNSEIAVDAALYSERIFPAFDNLTPAQQRLIIDVLDPTRLQHPTVLDDADEYFNRRMTADIPKTWFSRWVDLTGSFMYDVNGDVSSTKYLSRLAARYPAERVLYPASGFDRSVSRAFGADHVVHLSHEDHYFQIKHVEHDFDENQPDIDVTGDVRAMPFRSEAFDLVVLKHAPAGALLANDQLGLKETLRVLRPGGKLMYARNIVAAERDELVLQALRPSVTYLDRYRWIDIFEKPIDGK